jgi:hypothetical protein
MPEAKASRPDLYLRGVAARGKARPDSNDEKKAAPSKEGAAFNIQLPGRHALPAGFKTLLFHPD